MRGKQKKNNIHLYNDKCNKKKVGAHANDTAHKRISCIETFKIQMAESSAN